MCHSCCPCIGGPVEFRRRYCPCGYSPCLTWCGWCCAAHDSAHNNKRWLPLTGLPLLYFMYCHAALELGQLCNWVCTGGYVGRRCTCECAEEPYENHVVPQGCPTWEEWKTIAMGDGSPVDWEWDIEQVKNRKKPRRKRKTRKPKASSTADKTGDDDDDDDGGTQTQPQPSEFTGSVNVHRMDFDLPDDLS